MNLLGMLSETTLDTSTSYPNNGDTNQNIASMITPNNVMETPNPYSNTAFGDSNGFTNNDTGNRVVFLPTYLTRLQRDISEAIVQMFAPALEQQLHGRSSITRLLSGGGAEAVDALYEHLAVVCRHPLLVVDHFVPKKLLLSETSERLVSMSGKLETFNRLVDRLVDRCDGGKGYSLLVVAQSVKELEWIEGVIVGKRLKYENLSARKLFDAGAEDETREPSEDESEIRRGRRRAQKRARMFAQKRAPAPEVHVRLVTTRQAEGVVGAIGASNFDAIFAFDQTIQHQTMSNVRMIVPVPVYSVEHMSRVVPGGRVAAVKAFVANRFRLWEAKRVDSSEENGHYACVNTEKIDMDGGHALDSFLDGAEVGDLLALFEPEECGDEEVRTRLRESYFEVICTMERDEIEKREVKQEDPFASPSLKLETDSWSLDHNGIQFNKAEWSNSRISDWANVDWADYEALKSALARFLNARIEHLDRLMRAGSKVLPARREAETARQEQIDADEDRVSELFRKLRRLNDDAAAAERRLARAETDFGRAQRVAHEAISMLTQIKSATESLEVRKEMAETAKEVVVEVKEGTKTDTKSENNAGVDMDVDHTEEDKSEPNNVDVKMEGAENEKTNTDGDKEPVTGEIALEEVLADLEAERERLAVEHERLTEESEKLRAQYQAESARAVRATGEAAAARTEQQRLEKHLTGPGMTVLPSLARKDELHMLETRLRRLEAENAFLSQLLAQRLERLVRERSALLDSTSTGLTSRPTNRISRASSPFT